jgi:radical SAM protein with 4Fe4S-binding SPASM domain
MKKDSYEAATRVSGSFEASRRGIKLLLDKKIPFVVKGALLPDNKKETDGLERWAAKIPWMDKPPSYSVFFDLRCRRDGDKNEIIKKLRASPREGLKFLARRQGEYIKNMKEFCSKFMRPPGEKIFSCGAGRGGGCVDAYGNFQPCMMLRHPGCVYSLRNRTLKDAMINFFPKVREMKAKDPDYIRRCARCFLKGLCEQCPAKAWAEHGTLDTPVEYLCEVAHAKASYLGLLKEGEKGWEVVEWRKRISEFAKGGC